VAGSGALGWRDSITWGGFEPSAEVGRCAGGEPERTRPQGATVPMRPSLFQASSLRAGVGLVMLLGGAVFAAGDWVLDQRGASARKDATGAQADGAPLAIVFGSVLDGIPESFVLGLTVLQGGVSVSLLAGVVLSNLPEGMSSSSGLRAAGWPARRVYLMWSLVVLVSAISAAAGYLLLDPASGRSGALVQAFAAGALLAMLADTLLPEAYAVEKVFIGPLVVAGFAISVALSAI
jgi:zinc transporter, ZIP family